MKNASELLLEEIREAVWEDSVDGFSMFYMIIHNTELPKHAKEWIEHIYKARKERYDGSLIWCWRGSWKSTVFMTFLAWNVGRNPGKTNMVIMANDDSADKITSAVAEIIENNPNWKGLFPHVIPNKSRGWGAEGYWVKDSRIDDATWARMQSSVIDPSFVGGGVGTSRLIGKHPSGVMIFDDIHDEKNSISEKERQSVVKIVSDTLLPMSIKEIDKEGKRHVITWIIAIGTPWNEDDAYHYLKNTGIFSFLSMPVMEASYDGEGVYIEGKNKDGIVFTDISGWWKLKWKEKFNEESIVAERAKGLRSFARMFMLDLKSANVNGLKYFNYPHEQLDVMKMPMWGGVDFATVMEQKANPGRDFFSMAYGVLTAMNQLVVYDGVLEQCTQAQAEDHIKSAQSLYPNWRTTLIEGDGAGETFFVSLKMRNPTLRVWMDKTKGKSKRYRQEQEMGPWLERGQVLISDASTPYLNALRKALDDFPDGNNDIRDGLYWLCRNVPQVLRTEIPESELPKPIGQFKKSLNPFRCIAKA